MAICENRVSLKLVIASTKGLRLFGDWLSFPNSLVIVTDSLLTSLLSDALASSIYWGYSSNAGVQLRPILRPTASVISGRVDYMELGRAYAKYWKSLPHILGFQLLLA